MVRSPHKILTFRRLTQVGNIRDLALLDRATKRAIALSKKADDPTLSLFARPYIYVALATCLEADIKYKCRGIMEISGNSIDAFRILYGQSKIDLDLLYHVVNENITLADLIADSVTVSDASALISKHEAALAVLSGRNDGLKYLFQKCAEREEELRELAEDYDEIVRVIDRVFQIRHAIVHDVITGQGPIKWALRPEKLREATGSCLSFLLFADRAFMYALTNGCMTPEIIKKLSAERHERSAGEARRTLRRLGRRFKRSKRSIDRLEELLFELLDTISSVVASFGQGRRRDVMLSLHTVETYIAIWMRVARALQLESSITK